MKKLIILLLVFNSAYGQEDSIIKSETFIWDDSFVIRLSDSLKTGSAKRNTWFTTQPPERIDTVLVFMQVNDTTKNWRRGYFTDTLIYEVINPLSFGMYGYSVRSNNSYWSHQIRYLDADKRPLKNIVVWQAIEVK